MGKGKATESNDESYEAMLAKHTGAVSARRFLGIHATKERLWVHGNITGVIAL